MPTFHIPSTILTGANVLREANFSALGSRALVVTAGYTAGMAFFAELLETLDAQGVAYTVYADVNSEPTVTMVTEGLALYRANVCDFLIGIGGGSPLDVAKAIAAMSANPGTLADYMGREIAGDVPPVAAIPTTAGTGSEATKFTIITDEATDVKMLLKGDALLPTLAVVDERASATMPPALTAATGLDALTHAVEAFTSRRAMAMTDTFAVSAVQRILKYLPIAYRDGTNAEARREMALAALEAGICINNSSVTIVHGMSRPIGALFHVPHGLSNAMLLPICLRDVMDGAAARFAELSRRVGVSDAADDTAAANALLDALDAICRTCEVPTPKQYGIDPAKWAAVTEKMAADAIASGSPGNCWKAVTAEDCMRLYGAVFAR